MSYSLTQIIRSFVPLLVLVFLSTESVSAGQRAAPVSDTPANSRKVVLSFSSYIGGTDAEEGRTIVADSSGFVYVAGRTKHEGKDDIFLAKMRSDGSEVIYTSYLGGSDED